MDLIGNNLVDILGKTLDAASLRQRVIANNIANINTPGFKKSVVSFEDQLAAAMGEGGKLPLITTDPRQIGGINNITPEVEAVNSTSMRSDGNNVDINQEMVNLAVNSIHYDLVSQELNDRLKLLGNIITSGGN